MLVWVAQLNGKKVISKNKQADFINKVSFFKIYKLR